MHEIVPVRTDKPTTMVTRAVRGRHSVDAFGLPALHSMSLVGADGSTMNIGHRPEAGSVTGTAQMLGVAEQQLFSVCPICLSSDGLTDEHVPPEKMGGAVATVTCRTCNNEFGSRYEPALLDWYEVAVRASYSNESVPGIRKGPRLLLRQTDKGERALVFDIGKYDPAVSSILRSTFQLHFTAPDMRAVRLAALKNAYLAACVIVGGIPRTLAAEEIRSELAEAARSPRDEKVEISERAKALRIGRSYEAVAPRELGLAFIELEDGVRHLALSLARAISVSWPLETGPIRVDQSFNVESK